MTMLMKNEDDETDLDNGVSEAAGGSLEHHQVGQEGLEECERDHPHALHAPMTSHWPNNCCNISAVIFSSVTLMIWPSLINGSIKLVYRELNNW